MRALIAVIITYGLAALVLFAPLSSIWAVVMLYRSFCIGFLLAPAIYLEAGKQQRFRTENGLSIKVSTAETLKPPEKWLTSPRLKP